MITVKIKSMFQFIDFLFSNIKNFNKYDELINELEKLKNERNSLNPENNYKDKLQYNKLQNELEIKFKKLQDNTANIIKTKAKELNVCSFENEPNYSFNGIETEIHQLKDNFISEDLKEIFKYKNQYIAYRTTTHKNFLSLGFFFDELDKITKSLFDFFKDNEQNEQNEFEGFEKEIIMVHSHSNAIDLYSKGYKDYKFEINNSYSMPDLSNGIFDLTLQNLVDCGLTRNDTIEFLNTSGKYTLECNEGNFFVSGEEKKVYTGIEFYRKTYFDNGNIEFPFSCPDLIPDYFDLSLNEFKQKQNKLLGNIYNDRDAFFEFIKNETDKMQKRIEAQKEYLLKHKHYKFESKENDVKICEAYIQYLSRKKDDFKQLQQNKISKPNELIKDKSLTIKTQKEFKDFFNTDAKIEVIIKINNDFKDYYGKKMAVLIYLLESEFNLIKYSLDSKTDSRKHFVDSLNKSKINMQPINKCFITHSYKLDIRNFEKDKVFLTIKEKLEKTIK